MTSLVDARSSAALRRAAVRATYASSIHNTQPWRFVLRQRMLCIYADRSRQLAMLDPDARQLVMSCGSALMNARVSIAASGLASRVERLPDGNRSDLLARVTIVDEQDDPSGLSALDQVLELRETNRRTFADAPVPPDVVAALVESAAAERGTLFVVAREEHRLTVAALARRATALELAEPANRAEIRAWTTGDPSRQDQPRLQGAPRPDGVIEGEFPGPCLLLLGTAQDRPIDWLCAGEALERVLLEVTRAGFAAGLLSQVVEVSSVRADLRAQLGLSMHPQMLLRVGSAPSTPAVRRRRLVDVLVEET